MLPPVTSWASQSNLNICRQPAHQLLKLNRPRAHNFQGPTQNCPLRELTRMTVAQRSFHLIFCDKNEPSLQALCRAFHGIQDVSFLTQDIRTLHRLRRPSAICSVGNSFGIMDGGVDWVVREMLSPPPARTSVQAKCQEAISEQFMGEQPVGTCMLLPARVTDVFDWLAYAPTMVVPEDCRGVKSPVRFAARGSVRSPGKPPLP
ncbi:hypothetical protein WJX84_001388 [Apatococcus fuscideae]|uniref:Uncharacterized protein n=1 Tax=Apatococcus fuscideae TaxID=2026836 RepID=A0AAW1SIX8_9CHLO